MSDTEEATESATEPEETTGGEGDNSEEESEKKGKDDQTDEETDNKTGEDEESVKDETKKDEKLTEKDNLWHEYMKIYVENQEKLKAADKFDFRKPAELPRLPFIESEPDIPAEGYPMNVFNRSGFVNLPNKLNPDEKVRIWRNMRADPPVDMTCFIPDVVPEVSKTDSGKWPGVWPCVKIDPKDAKKKKKKKKKADGNPCSDEDEEEPKLGVPEDDFADHKELWQARIPPTCPNPRKKPPMIDRSTGENHSLVDGDYALSELVSKKFGNRSLADICLRGLQGMHLPELDVLRVREKTWRWCFYQAIVALLVKTQLKYKYTWSGNIDYIYDQGWMLFTHMGPMNVKRSQILDDVTVYNYKYNIEVELVQEMKDIPRIADVTWDYFEKTRALQVERKRKELMHVPEKLDEEKKRDRQKMPVHAATKKIEEWFDSLDFRYQNCIFRTTRYSLPFWKDGLFWYLYNPYRCDEFGFWDDTGYACIMKFCSRDALKRHLVLLLLRAYVYELPEPQSDVNEKKPESGENKDGAAEEKPVEDKPEEEKPGEAPAEQKPEEDKPAGEKPGEEKPGEEETVEPKPDVFCLQIFQVIYKKSEISNVKLLQRGAPKPRMRPAKKKEIDQCEFDPIDFSDPCSKKDEIDTMEKPSWLKRFKITWIRCAPSKKKIVKDSVVTGKLRWHQFYVEEPYKLFSLWGEIHPSEQMFPRENRGKQMYACYIVCAGMTRIMAPEYWSPKTLDAIVMCGDKYYTLSKLEAEVKATKPEFADVETWDRYLMNHFKIGETLFEGNMRSGIVGKLYSQTAKCLWQALQEMFLNHPFGVLTCESTCVGVFKFCGAYYMCDVHSTGPPLFQYGDGVVYLIRTTCLAKFMTVMILTIGSPECSSFELNPIDITKVIDLGRASSPRRRMDRRNKYKLPRKLTKVTCPYEDDRRPDPKKWRPKTGQVNKKTIDKEACKGIGASPCQGAVLTRPAPKL